MLLWRNLASNTFINNPNYMPHPITNNLASSIDLHFNARPILSGINFCQLTKSIHEYANVFESPSHQDDNRLSTPLLP